MSQDTVNDCCDQLNGTVQTCITGCLPYCDQLNGTVQTCITGCLRKGIITAVRIDVLVSLAAVVYVFLAICGSHRRRRRNWFVQKGVLAAHTLCFSLVTYTLGTMQASHAKCSVYPIWAISLFILHGCTDSITAYSLEDNTGDSKYLYENAIYSVYVGLLANTWQNLVPLPILFLSQVAVYKGIHTLAAYQLARCSWNLNKMVADYMYDEHTRSAVFVPATMGGCHYLVDWPLSKSKLDVPSYATQLTADPIEVIDVEKVWQCGSLCPELKDTCLSFSLFHLLRRRFFGFACRESRVRAHDFVFKGLLLENEDGATDYDRVFKVIEVELAFMYDLFFTKYAAIHYGLKSAAFWSWISAILLIIALYMIPTHQKSQEDKEDVVSTCTIADYVITILIIGCAAVLELLRMFLYRRSIWGRVSSVCCYLRKGGCCKIGRQSDKQHYWAHKLGQYSLVQSVSYNPNPSEEGPRYKCRGFLERTGWSTQRLLIHPENYHASRVRKKSKKPIELPAEIKKALVDSLKRTDGKLESGKSFLVFNGAGGVSWAWSQQMLPDTSFSQGNENQTHLILTWHIATSYCEMAQRVYPSQNEGTELRFHLDVATKLSRYCAYLVVYKPKLLPGHHYDTRCVFDAVAGEATRFLQGASDKYIAMRNSAEPEQTIFGRGVTLGKQLEGMEEGTRWKVMADFWAEMMLYVAPSDNVKEHIEQLAQGGEFITHLWALLFHAGIHSVSHQAAPQGTLVPGSSSGGSAFQAPPPVGQAGQPPPEITTANEHHTDLPEASMTQAAPHGTLVPGSSMGGSALQAPPPVVQAGQPPPELTTANEHHTDLPEASMTQAAPHGTLVPGSSMGGSALQAPPPVVQAGQPPPEITTANEHHIDLPEASMTQAAPHGTLVPGSSMGGSALQAPPPVVQAGQPPPELTTANEHHTDLPEASMTQAAPHGTLVPGSSMGGSALQAPPPVVQAGQPPPEITTANEHHIDLPEASMTQAAPHGTLVPGSSMGGSALQAPPPVVQAGQPPPEITTANEHHIDLPGASSSAQQGLHE